MSTFTVGNRVRHSGHMLRTLRDTWNNCGEYARKQRAKDALDAAIAERGTVTAILPADASRGVSPGLEITWDSGSVSRCLDYRVEKVGDR